MRNIITDINLVYFIDLSMMLFLLTVQYFIYPSFKNIHISKLSNFHTSYQRIVIIILGPIMSLQIALISIDFMNEINTKSTIRLSLLSLSWVLTALISVPLHKKIADKIDLRNSIEKLIVTNYPRMILWSLIFLTNFI